MNSENFDSNTGGSKPQEIVTPASRVITAFGGVRATARALGRNQSSVSRWQIEKERGGLDGRVPSSLQTQILQVSQARGLGLTPTDLMFPVTSSPAAGV